MKLLALGLVALFLGACTKADPSSAPASSSEPPSAQACEAFCLRLFNCINGAVAFHKSDFPARCPEHCQKLSPSQLECAHRPLCDELAQGACGAQVAELFQGKL